MGLYRDENGLVFEVDDTFARLHDYQPVTPDEEYEKTRADAYAARGTESGTMGTVRSAATGLASGLTLGGSDWFLGHGLSEGEREALTEELAQHPYARSGGELTGAIVGGLAAPGSAAARTPAGYLGALASREVEAGLAQGGLRGTARALNVMGAEGGLQTAGQYIGWSALQDKETTAEGLAGALGSGYTFGAAGGGVALGVSKGTVAARRLFARADGDAAKVAEVQWTKARDEMLEATRSNANIARARLDDIRVAKTEALRYQNEYKAALGEEKIRAAAAEPRPVEAAPVPVEEGPAPLVDVGPQPTGQPTSVFTPPKTEVIKSSKIAARAPAEAATDLEAQLAGTKAKLDEGAAIKDIKPAKVETVRKHPPGVADILDELEEYSQVRRASDIEGANALKMRRGEPLSELRFEKTKELLGAAAAKEEKALLEALGEWDAVEPSIANDFLHDIKDPDIRGEQIAELRKQWRMEEPTGARRRQAVHALDRAHEESLQRIAEAGDDLARGQAVRTAQEIEDLLEHLATPKVQSDRGILGGVADWMDEIDKGVRKAERAEKASAKLAEVLGDDAHPVSQGFAKARQEAEREAEKKMFDRATRAIEDAEQFGPEYKTPKERVQYARERKLEADKEVGRLKIDEQQAQQSYKDAREQLRVGERDKRAALRADAKATRVAQAPDGKYGKLGALGGVVEIMDLPGLPKPSDLPVVGPLLGAWLKYKTLKAALGRAGGRVAATPDARVATLAARTRDRVARAVDKSLTSVAKASAKVARGAPQVAGILVHRIYDDGLPDAPKGASLPVVAGVRMRELQSYVSSPNAIEMDVRRELRGVTDPDVVAAAEKHRRVMFEYLASTLPKMPQPGLLERMKWQPNPLQAVAFARRMEAASDPAGLLEQLANERDMISLEAAETLRTVYPQLFAHAQQRLMQQASQMQTDVPYGKRVRLSLVYKLPLDSSLDPDRLNLTQSVFEKSATPAPISPDQPAAPPTPSVAQPTDISASYMTPEDRRALTR